MNSVPRARALARCCLLALGLIAAHSGAAADPRCARIDERQGVGPYDFRDRSASNLEMIATVERSHFRSEHQRAAMTGHTRRAAFVWTNLDYTLRAIPNHTRALYMLGVWELQVRKFDPEHMRWLERRPAYAPVQCYFERALRFAPDDQNVYNALARLMHRAGRYDEAIKAFKKVVSLAGSSPQAHYNLGLAYYSAGEYEKSAQAARKAYDLGFTKPELKQRLQRKGYWE